MSWTEAAGWIALGLNVWGNLALTKRDATGWLVRLACNAAWIVYSWSAGAWPLFANHVVFAGINVLGWHRWTKEWRVDASVRPVCRLCPDCGGFGRCRDCFGRGCDLCGHRLVCVVCDGAGRLFDEEEKR